MATKQVSDAIAPGEIVSVEKCAVVEIGNRDDDVVVKFDSSPFEYCLPGSAIRRIPPAQAEPVAAERINANNPSTVPERFRQCMIDAAEYIVPRAMNTPGAGYTTKEGVLQMLTDLLALSLNDGCIAAAWAFEQIVQSVPAKPALTSLPNWPPGAVADITAALDAELEQKVEAKEPWKPVAGEKVLVEAVVSEAIGSCIWVTTDGHTVHTIPLHLSQLSPLPVVQGENLGNS